MLMFDVEKALVEIKKKLLDTNTGINAKIISINSEKSSTDLSDYGTVYTLKTLNTSAIYLLIASQFAINEDVFISITIDSGGISIDNLGAVTLKTSIKLTVQDSADGSVDIISLRYLRCLQDVFAVGRWSNIALPSTMQYIENLEAQDYITVNDNRSWREIGLALITRFPLY